MPTTHHVLYAYLGIVPRTPEAAVLRLLVELGVQYVRADEGSLLALDQRKNQLVFAMTAGPAESEQTLLGQRVPLGKGADRAGCCHPRGADRRPHVQGY